MKSTSQFLDAQTAHIRQREQDFMAAFRGIPVRSLVRVFNDLTPGTVWGGCPKGHLASRWADMRRFGHEQLDIPLADLVLLVEAEVLKAGTQLPGMRTATTRTKAKSVARAQVDDPVSHADLMKIITKFVGQRQGARKKAATDAIVKDVLALVGKTSWLG
jgi:hypothetical protein